MSSQKIKEIRDQINSLKEEMKNAVKLAFEEGSKLIFEKYPNVKSFGWNQYTPYFMDGDECHFGVNYDPESIEINVKMWDDTDEDKWDENAADDISKFIGTFSDREESLKHLFGDHVSVKVTRKGVYVEDYDHD
jgi:hypothetical protein